jgi:hypothetical protein
MSSMNIYTNISFDGGLWGVISVGVGCQDGEKDPCRNRDGD